MEKKVRMICGEQVKVAVYNGKMRFMVQGSYYMLTPQNIEHYNAVRDKMHIHCNPDGSADITAAAIVSWDLPDNLLQEYADIMLNEIEIALEIDPGNLSSSEWHAGHKNPRWDDLLIEEERKYLIK